MYAGHSDREWTIWTKCKEGKQNRERVNQKLGKDFETRFCLKGKPFQILPPEPRVDVGSGFDVQGICSALIIVKLVSSFLAAVVETLLLQEVEV